MISASVIFDHEGVGSPDGLINEVRERRLRTCVTWSSIEEALLKVTGVVESDVDVFGAAASIGGKEDTGACWAVEIDHKVANEGVVQHNMDVEVTHRTRVGHLQVVFVHCVVLDFTVLYAFIGVRSVGNDCAHEEDNNEKGSPANHGPCLPPRVSASAAEITSLRIRKHRRSRPDWTASLPLGVRGGTTATIQVYGSNSNRRVISGVQNVDLVDEEEQHVEQDG